jgi:hypothetical protein
MINQYTQQDLKLAHKLVQEDLFNSLTNLEAGESLRLGALGKFVKKKCQIKSALFKEELGDKNTFIYYRISFKPFSKLKELLTNQIIKKYNLK